MKPVFLILLVFITCQGFSQSVKVPEIGLEVMTEDLNKITMGWYEAKKACDSLGNGWRLPSIDELEKIYSFKNEIGDFQKRFYWSSTDYGNGYAWSFTFHIGNAINNYKLNSYYVRAVRTLK
jgi:hypothetical protein